MRATPFLLAALAVVLAAGCSTDPTTAVQAEQRPSFDGTGFGGSGNVIQSDTTGAERGVGFVGSGN